jgi:hypothetical protein
MKPSTTVDEVLFALVLTGFGSKALEMFPTFPAFPPSMDVKLAAERTGKYSQRPVNGKANNTGHLDEEQP